jgi:hypothetical protein
MIGIVRLLQSDDWEMPDVSGPLRRLNTVDASRAASESVNVAFFGNSTFFYSRTPYQSCFIKTLFSNEALAFDWLE